MKRLVLIVAVVGLSVGVRADEGMWTFENFPRAAVAKLHGVQVTDECAAAAESVVRLETGARPRSCHPKAWCHEPSLRRDLPVRQLDSAAGSRRERLPRREP